MKHVSKIKPAEWCDNRVVKVELASTGVYITRCLDDDEQYTWCEHYEWRYLQVYVDKYPHVDRAIYGRLWKKEAKSRGIRT